MLKANYFYDNSHGWIVTSEDQVKLIGLTADDFSRFSYFRVLNGKTYYALEEDKDYYTFKKRLDQRNIKIDIKEAHDGGTSLIRTWSSIELLHTYKDYCYSGEQPSMVAAQ